MSIYISGMVMMPSEDDYVAVVVYGDGTIRSIFGNVIEGATAVPVPPHGRLIDADSLISRCKDQKGSYYGHDCAVIGEAVEFAQTVIEAEEGET